VASFCKRHGDDKVIENERLRLNVLER
jgi:hypothetical protein